MGYAARRAEIELLKGGPSIAVSGTTSVTAEADRTYRGGLIPAASVRDQWGCLVKKIFGMWQTEVDCIAKWARHRLAVGSGEAPDEPGAQQERPANVAGEARCPRPCGNRARSPERRCAFSVGAHDRERMRAAPGVAAATPDAYEAHAFITDSGHCWHSKYFCHHLHGKIIRHLVRPPRDRPLCDDCKDAKPAGAALFASLLHHVDRMRGATATEAASSESVRRLPRNLMHEVGRMCGTDTTGQPQTVVGGASIAFPLLRKEDAAQALEAARARPRPARSRGASPNSEAARPRGPPQPARPRGPPPQPPADEPPHGVTRTCASTRAKSTPTPYGIFEECLIQQEEAAARIRVNIVQYLDNLMAHAKPVRK